MAILGPPIGESIATVTAPPKAKYLNKSFPILEERWSKKLHSLPTILALIQKECEKKKELILTGEPTDFNDLSKIIKLAKKTGFEKVDLFTDGQKLADFPYARNLKESGLDKLIVYLYGHKVSLHDKIAREKGAFRRTFEGIQNWHKLSPLNPQKPTNLEIRPIIHPLNENFLYEILNLAFDWKYLGLKKIKIPMFSSALGIDTSSTINLKDTS